MPVYFRNEMEKMKKTKLMAGFTLVELLVVISIIALLLALLMPALGKAREQAMSLIDKTRVRQWGIANTTYCSENNGRFEMGFYKVGDKSTQSRAKGWTEVLYPYYKGNPEILNCPKVPAKRYQEQYPTDRQDTAWDNFIKKYDDNDLLDRTLIPWRGGYNDTRTNNFIGSIGKNAKLSRPPVNTDDGRNIYLLNYFTLSSLKNAARIPMFFDCYGRETYFYMIGDQTDGVQTHSSGRPLPSPPLYVGSETKAHSSGAVTTLGCKAAINRHGTKKQGVTVVCFADGSTRAVYLKELWELQWNPSYDWQRHAFPRASNAPAGTSWPEWMSSFKTFNLK
jgi:prepilin-type N-terminal cleavage/methylation domain-containing protein